MDRGFKKFLLNNTNISPNTAKHYFVILKRVLNDAVKNKIIQSSPAFYSSNVKTKDTKIDFLTFHEIKKLFETKYRFKYPDVKRAFLFSCYTGLRFSDIKQLKWKHIKSDNVEILQQKTSEYLYIPLSHSAIGILSPNTNIMHLPDSFVFNIPDRFSIGSLIKK